jgi:AbrB family looped-hinge helix DNA binding protein
MAVASAKLTTKHQITIPAAVRRRLGLQAGDVVYLVEEEGRIVLRSARGGWAESTAGLGADLWRSQGGVEMIDRERDSWK